MATLACCVLAAACSGASSPAPETVTLSFGHPFPSDHALQLQEFEQWAQDVHSATGGAVTVEIHPDETLSPAAETYQNVAAGGQDIGWGIQGYSPGLFPVTDVIEMPFVFTSAVEATKVLWELHNGFPALRDEYSDVKVLGLWATSPADLWLAQGSATTLDDLEGLAIRATGPVQAKWIKELGAAPVSMAAPDLREGLQSNEIDGLLTVKAAIPRYGLTDLLESGTECGCYVAASFLVMNIDRWNSLSEDQRAAIDEVSGLELSHAAATFYDNADAAAAPGNVEAGIAMARLGDTELDRWREAARSVVEDWIAVNAADFDARAMYERMLELAAG